jgi:hypothetical protein
MHLHGPAPTLLTSADYVPRWNLICLLIFAPKIGEQLFSARVLFHAQKKKRCGDVT